MPSFLEVATTLPFSYENAKEYTRSVEKPAFFISVTYIAVIFTTKAIMSNFKPFQVVWTLSSTHIYVRWHKTNFQLTSLLNFWNAWLAIFSTIGSIITGYGLFCEIYNRGLVCE